MVYFFAGEDVPISALTLIDKSEKQNLTKAERNTLAKLLPELAKTYRAGVKNKVQELRRRT